VTKVILPRLGVGTAAIGNLYAPVSDTAAHDTIRAAIDAGISYFDTAPHYGFGLAERRLGEALEGDTVLLSSKVGRVLEPTQIKGERHSFVDADPFEPRFDYTADGILRSYESSLARLRRDRVDILFAHDLGRATHGDAHDEHRRAFLGGGYRAMRDLKDAGAIDAIGIGVNEVEICLDLMDEVELDVILLAGRYTLLDCQAAEALIPECARRGIQLIIGGPFNSGILAHDHLAEETTLHFDYVEASPAIIARARSLARICESFGVSLPAAALQFPLRDPRIATVLAGVAGADQVSDLVARATADIPDALWVALVEGDIEYERTARR
jgi:D-threo-aldose 1-dehydrogenase